MNRQSFNPWMIELRPDEFSCAFAALSVLEEYGWGLGERTEAELFKRLRNVAEHTSGILQCRPTSPYWGRNVPPPVAARVLSAAWKKFASEWSPIRLEVWSRDPVLEPLWIVNELSRIAVGAASVYFFTDIQSPTERWHWPLRLGLLTDSESKDLGKLIELEAKIHTWAQDLLSVTPIIGKNQRCDLLLVPHEPRAALARVLDLAPGLTASCLFLTSGVGLSDRQFHLFESLQTELQTNAAASLVLTQAEIAPWFVNRFLRGFSHDVAFDLALWESLKKAEGISAPIYLAASSRWIESVRLSKMVATLMETVSRPEVVNELVDVKPDLASRLGVGKGLQPLQQLSSTVIHSYLGESHGATTLAHLTRAVAPTLRRKPPLPLQRELQARVFGGDSSESVWEGPLRTFGRGVVHRVVVRVGLPEDDWIGYERPFPEQELPRSRWGHRLTVILSEPALSTQPQVSHIELPPSGSSSECSFYLSASENVDRVEARITVLYRNRVLQTAILAGPMLGEQSRTSDEASISFLPEVVTSPGMADLDRQPSYDAALVINHTQAGTPQVLKIIGDNAELISTGDLMSSIQQIDDELGRCDWAAKDFRNIRASGTLKLLRFLAVHGALLYRGVVKQQFIDQGLAKARSIQLIAAKPGARLPVEYFYDRPSPDENAKLCPTAMKSLVKGECVKSCENGAKSSKYVCPLGFWGLTRVLEWHAYRPQIARELQNHDYALQQEKLGLRHQLPKLDQALIAASERANAEVKTSVSTLVTAIKKKNFEVTQSPSWDDWRKQVAKNKPPLLIVIPHLDVDTTFNVAKLEIGNGKWLRVDQVDESLIHGPGSQPIVLLLGCETGKQNVPFEDFVSAFASCGAAVVVSTATLILGRQATLLAQEFVSVLQKARKRKDATFGDVMLTVRRNMLRRGYPMVLSVSSYGDADWKL